MSARTKFLFNLKSAFIAQGISLITSFAISLLLPRILSVSGYGYWQLFLFYSSYIGIFYFGLCEGIYLENGGKTWETIDKSEIATKIYLGFFMQVVIACCIVAYVLFSGDTEGRSFVLLSVAGMVVLSNTYGFLGTLFQALFASNGRLKNSVPCPAAWVDGTALHRLPDVHRGLSCCSRGRMRYLRLVCPGDFASKVDACPRCAYQFHKEL